MPDLVRTALGMCLPILNECSQEGIIPAPEPTHAIAAAIREALHCKETGEEKVSSPSKACDIIMESTRPLLHQT